MSPMTPKHIQLLVDTGSFIHVAPMSLAPWIPLQEKDDKVKAVGADGRELTYYGKREVSMITTSGMVRILFTLWMLRDSFSQWENC